MVLHNTLVLVYGYYFGWTRWEIGGNHHFLSEPCYVLVRGLEFGSICLGYVAWWKILIEICYSVSQA